MEKVGNGLKTVSMRIRGISEESGEAIPKLDGLIKRITGVDMMEDENTFKSTYQIMLEISKVWKQLTDTDRATLLEKLFGKHQGAVGASLLNNMADGVSAMNTAVNSFGSSAKEQARYMDSIQAKVNEFKESTTRLWVNTIDSETIKTIVKIGTEIVNLIDKIGLLNTALSGVWIYLTFSGKLKKTGLAIKGLATAIMSVNVSANLLKTTLISFAPLAIITGIIAISSAVKQADENVKKFLDTTENELDTQKKQEEQLNKLKDKYEEVIKSKDNYIEKEKSLKSIKEELISLNPTIIKSIDGEKDAYKNLGKEIQETIDKQKKYGDLYKENKIIEAKSNIKHLEEKIVKLEQDIQDKELRKQKAKNENGEESGFANYLAGLANKDIDELNKLNKELSETIKLLNILEGKEPLENLTPAIEDTTEKFTDIQKLQKTVLDSYNETSSSISELNAALETLAENKSLTADETAKLIKNYPELIDLLKIEDGQVRVTAEAIETLRQTKIGEYNVVVETEKAKVEALAKSLSQKLTMFDAEIAGVQSKAEAYLVMESIVQKITTGASDAGIRNRLYEDYSKDLKLIGEGREKIKALEALANSTFDKIGKKVDKSAKDSFSKSFNLYETSVAQINDEIDKLQSKLNSATELDEISSLTLELEVKFKAKKDLIERELKEINTQLEKAYKSLPEEYRLKIQSGFTVEDINLTGEGNKSLAEAIETTIKLRDEQLKLGKELRSVGKEFEGINKSLEDYSSNSLKLVSKSVSSKIKSLKDELESILTPMEKALDKYKESQNKIIEQKKEQLKLLKEQYDEENRLKKLYELNEEIAKVYADQRHEYINQFGEIEYTYDKEKYNELVKQRQELLEQYKRDDIIKAKEKEIEELEKARDKEIKHQEDEIKRIKEKYDTRIKNYESFNNILSEMQNMELDELRSNISSKINELQKYSEAWEANSARILAAQAALSKVSVPSGSSSSSSGSSSKSNTISNKEAYNQITNTGNTSVDKARKELLDKILKNSHHSGLNSGFASGKSFDAKTETIAKLLKDEIVLTKPQFYNIVPNVTQGLLKTIAPTTNNTNTTKYSIHIDKIVTDNPMDFFKQINHIATATTGS